jgi:hypothetical protein
MNQFTRIQGASSQETFWFSRTCNAVAGQIDHIGTTVKLLQSAASKRLNGQKPIAARFSLHIFAVLPPFRPCL